MNSNPLAFPPSPIEVFIGQTNPAVAHVYVRWHAPCAAGATLTGSWKGPNCRHTRCLPFTAQFADQGPGDAPLARVTVPDPCSWTPDFPAIYEIQMELRAANGQVIDTASQWFGLRPLAARRRSLVCDGQRIVLRGVELAKMPRGNAVRGNAAATNDQLRTARDLHAALITTNPDESFCEAASREGVILIARLDCASDQLAGRLRGASRWPAVSILLLRDPPPQLPLSQLAPQVLIGQEILHPRDEPVAAWAEIVVCHLSRAKDQDVAWMRQLGLPCLALRHVAPENDAREELEHKRRECDVLQRDLAGQIELAGFLVGP